MADYTITPASVASGAGAVFGPVRAAGEALTAGAPVYLKASDQKYYLADNNVTVAEANVEGICVTTTVAAGQYFAPQISGAISYGVIFTARDTVILSATVGKLAPAADISTNFLTYIGYASTTAILILRIYATGV